MRRVLIVAALVAAALTSWSAHPAAQRRPTLSDDVSAALARGTRARVIVQADDAALGSLRWRHARGVRRQLTSAIVLDLDARELAALVADGALAHVSGDLPVVADMAVTNKVTAADKVWAGTPGLLGLLSIPGYDGSDIGVAVLDSGIAEHTALTGKVAVHVNMVSSEPNVTGDPFGHGTHVAGIIGGRVSYTNKVTSAYSTGTAPGARLVDVRVLGANGAGYTSDVIAGIDWTIEHRRAYNIRIINLSLGHPVAEPSATDPLCRAVARAVSAGIVVVVSAGNYGRTADTGAPVLGGITSPGNSPFAITVGALDTAGTVDLRDDRVAAYSSRGPTKYDFAAKPDVVAPGSRIVSLEANGSYLSRTYPAWHVAGSGRNAYLRLSGTSMAAPVVTGGVALLLDENSALTPAQVKLAIQAGARYMPDDGLIAAGTGSVNFSASQTLARGGLLPSLLNTLASLLGGPSGAMFQDTGALIDRLYGGTGMRLLGLIDVGWLWSNADHAESGVLNLIGGNNPISTIAPNYVVWGSVADWSNSYYVVWGSTLQSPEGQYVVWGSECNSDYVVWGSQTVPPDGKK